MKTPVTITAVHLDVSYTADRATGSAKVLLEINGKLVEVICEKFGPGGFHISHICEGAGILKCEEAV